MHRFWEILLGLEKGFLARDGELHLHFNPHWPWQQSLGAVSWNLLLAVGGAILVYQVYRREGRSTRARIMLGGDAGDVAGVCGGAAESAGDYAGREHQRTVDSCGGD